MNKLKLNGGSGKRVSTLAVRLCLLLLLVFLLSGCIATPGGLAPSTIPITANDSYTITQRNATGSDWSISIVGFPLVPCSAYTALQNVKEEYNADALINVTGDNMYYSIVLISLRFVRIRGDAIKFQHKGEIVE